MCTPLCRKRPIDDATDFDTAMKVVSETLMNVSKDFLNKSSSVVSNESEFEFAEYICESLVSLGSTNLQCLTADSTSLSCYLQQVMFLPYLFYNCKSFPSLYYISSLHHESTCVDLT